MEDDDRRFSRLERIFERGFETLADLQRETNARLDQTNARLDQTNARLDKLEGKVEALTDKVEALTVRVERIEHVLVTSPSSWSPTAGCSG